MDRKDIAALFEELCDRPLTSVRPELSALAVSAVATRAAEQSAEASADAAADPESGAAERVMAVLASILSSMEAEAAQGDFDQAALRAAAVRLDAHAALAFLDRMEGFPVTAPAHLVEQILATAAPQRPKSLVRAVQGVLSAIPPIPSSMRGWRIAAASTVLLVAGVLSWSAYWENAPPAPVDGARAPPEKTSIETPFVRDAAVEPKPAPTMAQPCEPPILSQDTPHRRLEPSDRSTQPDRALQPNCEESPARAADTAGAAGPRPTHADRGEARFGARNFKPPTAAVSAPAKPHRPDAAPSVALPPILPRDIAPTR